MAATTSTIGRNDRPRPHGAFTLIELIVVLVVISVALAMAAPRLRGFLGSRETADAALTMVSLMKWAQSQATTQGRLYRLNIDPGSGTYWVTAQQAGAFVDLGSDFGRRFQLPEGATASLRPGPTGSDVAYVQFYPNGRNDPATIEIRGAKGEEFLITSPSATEQFRVISPSEAP